MKKLLAIVLALAMVLSLAACGATGGSGEKTLTEDGRISNITTAVSSEIQNLLPTNGNGNPKAQFYWNIYESLFTFNSNMEFAPCLAKSWEVIDGTHWNIHLFQKIYDSKGNHITAEDVVYSFEWLVKAGESLNFDIFKGITAVDEYTVQIEWTQTPTSTADIEFPLTRTFVFDKDEFNETTFATAPVATGSYVVSSFITGSEMVLKANPDYWALKTDEDVSGRLAVHNATVDTLTYRIIQGSDTAEIELEMGNIDYCDYIKYLSLEKFQNNDKYVVSVEVSSDYAFMGFNMDPSSPLADDLNLRLAIAYALDSNAIAAAMPGSYSGMKTYGTPYFSDYDPAWETEENYLNVHSAEKAKEYLAASNYAANGSPKLEVICKSAEADKNAVQMILGQLSAVGINVEMKSVDQATFQTDTSDPTNWDLLFFNPMGGKDLASSWKLALADLGNKRTDGDTGSLIFHNDEELFALYDVATDDATHNTENMKKVIDHVFANAYIYPVAYSVTARVYRADVISQLYLREGYVTLPASTYAGQEVNKDPEAPGQVLTAGDVSAAVGTYTFSEVVGEGSGKCEYKIELKEDGTYRIDQANMYGENVWIEGTYMYVDGTVVCAAPEAGVQGPMDRWLNSGWTNADKPEPQWILNGDGTATPVGYAVPAPKEEESAEPELPGIVKHFTENEGYELFNFYEKSDGGYITWHLMIKQEAEEGDSKSGSYVLVEQLKVGDKNELVYRGTYTQTKGDITLGAPNDDSDAERLGTIWNADGTVNFTIFSKGAVAHANMEGLEEYKTGVKDGKIPAKPEKEEKTEEVELPGIVKHFVNNEGYELFNFYDKYEGKYVTWHLLIKQEAEEGDSKSGSYVLVMEHKVGEKNELVYRGTYTQTKGDITLGAPNDDSDAERLGTIWNEDGTVNFTIFSKGAIAHANMEGIEDYKNGVKEGTIPGAPHHPILGALANMGFDRFDWTEESPYGTFPWYLFIAAGVDEGEAIIVSENPNMPDGVLVYHCTFTKDKGTISVSAPEEPDSEVKRLGGFWNEDGTSTWNLKGKGICEPTLVK